MEKMNFEQSLSRLEEITSLMESGNITLEDSLKYFEEGTMLASQCKKMLEEAEQRVQILTRDASGKFTTEDFHIND